MPRRPKQGIEFAGWSVDIFDGDTKIDKLLDAQGWVGFGIYFFLCQMAYKFDGYFYRWAYDDSASTARRMGGGIGSGTVSETVRYCLQISLFDQRLFDRWGILTSKGIQRRFLAAIQGRRVKSVISDYWLLNDEESEGLDKCVKNDDLQPTNDHLQIANIDLQPTNDHKSKVKESKGKESRGNTDARDARPAESDSNSVPFEKIKELYNTICKSFPKIKVIDGERRKAVSARWKTYSSIEVFEELFSKTQASDFMKGSNDRNWTADFDWVMKPTNMAKVLEGKYDNDRMMGGKSDRSGQKGRYGKPATVPDSEDVERKKLEYMRAMAAKMAEVDS